MSAPSPRPMGAAAPGIRATALSCLGLALLMGAAGFAAVPLYDIFCRATGFDGTPRVGTEAASEVLGRRVSVAFDTNVAPGLSWSFKPEVPSVEAALGQTQTVFFRVRNEGDAPSTGTAAFNVQPGQAGAFFVKLKCFCFEEQTLRPGESIDVPVVFYVDPDLARDPNLDGLGSITLSYTYFASRNGKPVASAAGPGAPRL